MGLQGYFTSAELTNLSFYSSLAFGDRLYQQCREGESLRGLWTMLRSAFHLVAVDSWSELLLNHLSDEARSP